MNTILKTLLPALLIVCSVPAQAIYKCESNGKVTYGDVPCRGGKVLDLTSGSSGSNGANSSAQIKLEKNEQVRLENMRHQREAKEEKEQHHAALINARKQKKCTSLAMHKKWSAEDAATASGKSAEKAKRNARRQAEKYEVECGK